MLSRSRSNQGATDPRNNTPTQVLETRSGKQPEHSKPQGGQTGPEGRLDCHGPKASTGQTGHQHRSDRSKDGHPSNTRWVTHPPHAGSPVHKQRQTGSPIQHTRGHPSKTSDAKPGPGRFDRLPGAVRPPPPEELRTTRIDPIQIQITAKINLRPLGRLD